MSSPFDAVLDGLIRHRGVTGCLVVDERDGIPVDQQVQVGLDAAVLAALAASLYRRACRSARAAGFGSTAFFELVAEEGRICAAGRNGLVLVVVAEPRVNVGLIRVEMLQAMEAFA